MGGFNRLDPDWYDFYIGVYDDRIHGEFHIVHSLISLLTVAVSSSCNQFKTSMYDNKGLRALK